MKPISRPKGTEREDRDWVINDQLMTEEVDQLMTEEVEAMTAV